MDPVHVLPDEIIEQIWNMLPLSDLLSCRAVSQTWLEILSRSTKIWRQYCCTDQLGDSCSWYDLFLSESKMKWPWKVASFTDALEIDNVEFYDYTNDHIYVVDRKFTLIKYDSSGRFITQTDIQDPCVKLFVINNDVMVLYKREIDYQVDFFNEDLVLVKTSTLRFGVDILSRIGLKWSLYYFKDRPFLMEKMDMVIQPLNDGWCLKAPDQVFIERGHSTDLLYSSPLQYECRVGLFNMFTDRKNTVVIIDEMMRDVGDRPEATVIIFRDGVKLTTVNFSKPVRLWCFSGPYLVLISKYIYTIHLITAELTWFRRYFYFLVGRSRPRIYDILNHPQISLVLVDCEDMFGVLDAASKTVVSTFTCPSRSYRLYSSLKSIYKPTMIVYRKKHSYKIVAKKPILQ